MGCHEQFRLPAAIVKEINNRGYREFSNGVMQLTVKCSDGIEYPRVIILEGLYVLAILGHKKMPFSLDSIVEVTQSQEDEVAQLKKKELHPFFFADMK